MIITDIKFKLLPLLAVAFLSSCNTRKPESVNMEPVDTSAVEIKQEIKPVIVWDEKDWLDSKLIFKIVTDIDGNSYPIIKIQNQGWMAQNLQVKHFRNGDTIYQAQSDKEWKQAYENRVPAWCFYVDSILPKNTSILYNYHAVNDPRGLAPNGCKVASSYDFIELFEWVTGNKSYESVFGITVRGVGEKIKSPVGWENKQSDVDKSGFNALPFSTRWQNGKFDEFGRGVLWYTADEMSVNLSGINNEAHISSLNCPNCPDAETRDIHEKANKGNGQCVRCVLDDNNNLNAEN
jgi:uncharacterized protein (TIGR02145 family)